MKLCSIRQRYNLKANHNGIASKHFAILVVFNTSKIQFESKSQHFVVFILKIQSCVQYVKDTIWKQITTYVSLLLNIVMLCSIRQRYNLKANHNQQIVLLIQENVVFNTSKIQFESKSQPFLLISLKNFCCVQYVKDTIWKQITTWS